MGDREGGNLLKNEESACGCNIWMLTWSSEHTTQNFIWCIKAVLHLLLQRLGFICSVVAPVDMYAHGGGTWKGWSW